MAGGGGVWAGRRALLSGCDQIWGSEYGAAWLLGVAGRRWPPCFPPLAVRKGFDHGSNRQRQREALVFLPQRRWL